MGNIQQELKDNGRGKRKGTLGSEAKPFSDKYRFINFSPTPQDKERIKSINWSGIDLVGELSLLAEDGYKLSISAKDEGAPGNPKYTYTASLTGVSCKGANRGYILTGRGSDAGAALTWLYYLHFVVFGGIWGTDPMSDWSLD